MSQATRKLWTGDRTVLIVVTCTLALFTTGCLHPKVGPQSLPRDRATYSASLSDSWKEQTLLNIVKVRYVDPPIFVDVGNIVASYTLAQSASAGGKISTEGAASNGTLGGSISFSNTPTITYTPLTGNAYIKGLATPLPVTTVFGAIQNGLPADLILLTSVVSINGLRNQQVSLGGITPADADFTRVLELMRNIHDSGAVRIYVKEDAAKQQVSVLALRTTNITPEIQANILELRRLLRLNPDATELRIVAAPLSSSDTELAVMTRSITGLIQNLAAQVEVPPEDVARHYAIPGFETGRDVPGVTPMIRIHSSKKKPEEVFVSIRYDQTWFWIDKGDLVSKRTFALLMQLFTMAETGPKENLPVVTIPAH